MQPDESTPPALRLVGEPPGDTNSTEFGPAAPGQVVPGAAHPRTRRPPLLATKLRTPPAYQNVIARARLLDLLNQGQRRAMTVVAAPAGFGKTTLLGNWSRQTGRPTAWVSLDEGDNDPTRFWSYVIASLDHLQDGAGESALALLQSPQPPPIDAVLTVLINDLAGVAHDITLVLDDYHLIEAPAVHHAVTFLIDHLPPQAHVVVTTRTEPPLPLPRWRARGQLLDLRSADLRFQPDEAAAFLAESMDLQLSSQETAQLVDRTEGWIAGLQLIALSLQKHDDVARVIRELTGAPRFILDYLAEEVLVRQSARVQAFLLQTSILERLTGPLCDAVTGQADSRAVLVELERANLFVVPLDEERRWYRYHHLFAEFLRGRLQSQQGDLVATLHRRAARWYEAQGMHGDAIGHALSAAEYADAAAIIEQIGQERLMGGELSTLQGWLDQMPDEIVATRPRLSILQAWLLAFAFRAEQAERYLQCAEQALDSLADDAVRRSLLNEVAAARAISAATKVDLARLRELAGRNEEHPVPASDDNAFLRSVRHFNRALTLELSGDIAASNQEYRELTASSQASGNVVVALLALSQLGDQFLAKGQLHRAADTYRQGLRLAGGGLEDGDRPAAPLAALAHFGLALVLIEWNDLDAAAAHVDAALTQGQQLANPLVLAGVYLGLARLHQSRGRHSAALEALDRADQGARGTDLGSFMLEYTDAVRVRSHIMDGALAHVEDWVDRYRARERRVTENQIILVQAEALEKTTLLRALIALGHPREAIELVEPLCRTYEAAGLGGIVIELLLLRALAHHAQGEEAAAVAALAESLALAAPEGYTRLYADEGPAVARLLTLVKRSPAPTGVAGLPAIPVAYLDRLIAASGRSTDDASGLSPKPADVQKSPLIEPLSEREREALRLVAAGLTNQEIAATLVVEVSTVKTHLQRIYGKLGVHSRTQAVSRARELQLLP